MMYRHPSMLYLGGNVLHPLGKNNKGKAEKVEIAREKNASFKLFLNFWLFHLFWSAFPSSLSVYHHMDFGRDERHTPFL